MKKTMGILMIGLCMLIISGCGELGADTNESQSGSVESTKKVNKDVGVITTYDIGDRLVGANRVGENMNFIGFVNDTVVISYDLQSGQTMLYYPLEKGYVITPYEDSFKSFTSQYEIMDFDIKKGTIELKKVK